MSGPDHRERGGGQWVRRLFFITHADVVQDPDVPVPRWPLSDAGRARHRSLNDWLPEVASIWSSDEQKAIDGAGILGAARGLTPSVLPALGEIDRSATGFLPAREFEDVADRFFAEPEVSVRGWERAVDAQGRIVAALREVARQVPEGDIAVVSHGAVGALAMAHLAGAPIARSFDQPGRDGGHLMVIGLPGWSCLSGWQRIEVVGSV